MAESDKKETASTKAPDTGDKKTGMSLADCKKLGLDPTVYGHSKGK